MRQKRAVPTALARERQFSNRADRPGAIGVPPSRLPSVRQSPSKQGGPTGLHHSRDLGALRWPGRCTRTLWWAFLRFRAIPPFRHDKSRSVRRRLHAALADEGRRFRRRHELDQCGSWRDELAVSKTGPQQLSERNSTVLTDASGSCHNRTHAAQQVAALSNDQRRRPVGKPPLPHIPRKVCRAARSAAINSRSETPVSNSAHPLLSSQ
jgi:hypothetical protein